MENEFMENKERMIELKKGARRMLYEIEYIEGRSAAEILEEYIYQRYLALFGRCRAKADNYILILQSDGNTKK